MKNVIESVIRRLIRNEQRASFLLSRSIEKRAFKILTNNTVKNQIERVDIDQLREFPVTCTIVLMATIRQGSLPKSIALGFLIDKLRQCGRHGLIAELLLLISQRFTDDNILKFCCDYFYATQDFSKYKRMLTETSLREKPLFNIHVASVRLMSVHPNPIEELNKLTEKENVIMYLSRANLLFYCAELNNCCDEFVKETINKLKIFQFPIQVITSIQKFIIRKRLSPQFMDELHQVVINKYSDFSITSEYNLWRLSFGLRRLSWGKKEIDDAYASRLISSSAARDLATHHAWLNSQPTVTELESFEIYRSKKIKNQKLFESIMISGAVWGETVYVDGLFAYALKSLVESGEILRLSEISPVVVNIHTTRQSFNKIRVRVEEFEEKYGINFRVLVTLGDLDETAVSLRGIAYMSSLREAAACNHTYIGLCPDGIYGTGLAGLVRRCASGDAATGTIIRVSKNKFLNRFGSNADALLSTSNVGLLNKRLLELAISDIPHEVMIYYFQNRLPGIRYSYSDSSNRGVSSIFMNLWVLKPNYETLKKMIDVSSPRYNNDYLDHLVQFLDHELGQYLHLSGQLKLPSSFDEFVFIELTLDSGYSNVSKSLEIAAIEDFHDQSALQVPISKEHSDLIYKTSAAFNICCD